MDKNLQKALQNHKAETLAKSKRFLDRFEEARQLHQARKLASDSPAQSDASASSPDDKFSK